MKKKKAKESEVAIQLFSPDGTSESYDAGNATLPRPIGNKASKRKVEEEKIIDNVTSKLKEGHSSGGTGTLVAKAITDFSFVLSSFFNQWQDTIMCQSVDPSLRKTYQELLMKEKIYELEKKQQQRMGKQITVPDGQCQLKEQHMEEQHQLDEQQHVLEEQCHIEQQHHMELQCSW